MADKRNFIVDDDMKVLEVSIKTIEADRRIRAEPSFTRYMSEAGDEDDERTS